MSQPGATCPETLSQESSNGLTLCFGTHSSNTGFFFSTFGLQYTRVCGQFRGYQQGKPDSFANDLTRSIDNSYVDGVSITYGNPRMHIWTYAVGNDESSAASSSCLAMMVFHQSILLCMLAMTSTVSPVALMVQVLVFSTRMTRYGTVSNVENMESTCCGRQNMPWF